MQARQFYKVSILWVMHLVMLHNCLAQDQDLHFQKLNTNNGLSSDNINCLFQDSKGFVWIGTNGGLNKFDGQNCINYSDLDDGIRSYLISSICEDSEGRLWIGSKESGLYSFDPMRNAFGNYRENSIDSSSILSNYVQGCAVSMDGIVAINTQNGFSILYPGEWPNDSVFHSVTFEDKKNIRRFFPVKQEVFCCNTVGSMFLIDLSKNSDKKILSDFRFKDNSYIFSSEKTEDGNIWGCGKNKLMKLEFDKISNQYFTSEYYFARNGQTYMPGEVNCLAVDHHNFLWIGTSNNGLLKTKVNHQTKKIEVIGHYMANASKSNALSNNLIRDLMVDNTNALWIGTEGGGVNILNLEAKPFESLHVFEDNQNSNLVKTIIEDQQKNLWIGIDGSGVFFVPAGTNSKKHIIKVDFKDEYLNDVILSSSCIYQTSDGILWIGTEGRGTVSFRYNYNAQNHQLSVNILSYPSYNNSILSGASNTCMFEDKDGFLWIGTYSKGLNRAHRNEDGKIIKSEYLIHDPSNDNTISSNIIRSIAESPDGSLWVGTGDGLNKLIRKGSELGFKRWNATGENRLSNNYILPLYFSRDGSLWVGTLGGGVNHLAFSNGEPAISKHYKNTNGLLSNVIKGILEDDLGNLWISSNQGISKLNPKSGKISNYTYSDGLQGNSFTENATVKTSDGKLYFGGVDGVTSFYPEEITQNPYLPEISLSDLKIFNRVIKPGESLNGRVILKKSIAFNENIELLYRENNVEIDFVVLHHRLPKELKIRYRLTGFDDHWIEINDEQRAIKYTSLPHGKFNLELELYHQDFPEQKKIRNLHVVIKPPLWLTPYAFVVYFLILIGLVYLFSRFSIIKNNRKNELMMADFEKKKSEELSQMKLDFFAKISHEFRTPLTIIVGSIDKLFNKEQKEQRSYKLIQSNINIILRLINQLTNFRKYEQGVLELAANENNIVSFVYEVFESFCDLAENKRLEFKFESEKDTILLFFDTDKLEKIIYNLLSNAIKYTPEGGQVAIKIKDYDDSIELVVADNGIGIEGDKQKHVFDLFYKGNTNQSMGTGIGLAFSKSMAQMHSGELTCKSEVGKGSVFCLRLKKGSHHFTEEQLNQSKDRSGALQNLTKGIEWKKPIVVGVVDATIEVVKSSFPKILIVEDDIEIRTFLKDHFDDSYQIIEASDGREGMDKCLQHHPDLVLSDLMMPEVDGYELCRLIKENESTNHIPIILLTALSTDEDRIKGFSHQADGFMSKPFNPDVLKERINALIRNRQKLIRKSASKVLLEPTQVNISKGDELFLNKARKLVEKQISTPEYGVAELSNEMGLSSSILNGRFKKLLGYTSNKFIRDIRMKRAAQLLKLGTTVSDTALETGYNSVRRFRDAFKEHYGVTPSEFDGE